MALPFIYFNCKSSIVLILMYCKLVGVVTDSAGNDIGDILYIFIFTGAFEYVK